MLRMQVSCSSCKCAYFPVICMVRCFVRMQGRCVFLVCMSVFVSYAGSFFFFFFFMDVFFLDAVFFVCRCFFVSYAGVFCFRLQYVFFVVVCRWVCFRM